jgi:hypothetical protein
MHPLTTFERRLLCVCALPGPVKTAAHIYPPKVDRLYERTQLASSAAKGQMRRADRFIVRSTDSLPFSLGILGDHIDGFPWFRGRGRLI